MQIVAPAGSRSMLNAAISAGADAVYLGLPKFGARAKAENFDGGEFKSAVEYAHIFGTKVFVTLNTLIKDAEMSDALHAAKFAFECGVDAAIVQDLRYIKNLKTLLPSLPLHASTQMGIHNEYGAKVLLDMGIKRAVLARETLPEDIYRIKKTGIEIEFFVQGALCVCFSGNCYFSSLASSYSGNRGKCMQLCRKPYTLDGETGYKLSAKDLCLYSDIGRLNALGVDSIKIEGRMRSDEYVYESVRVYKSDLPKNKAVEGLKRVFNRGNYCNAYLDEDAPFRVIYDKCQSNIGTHIGKIDKVDGFRVFVNGFIPKTGDGFKVMRGGKELCGAAERNGVVFSEKKCERGDELRQTLSGETTIKVKSGPLKKLDIDVSVDINPDKKPIATMSSYVGGSVSAECNESAQIAVNKSISRDDVNRVFSKVANYPFAPKIKAHIDDNVFMPMSALNEFRRNAYSIYYDKLVSDTTPKREKNGKFALNYNPYYASGVMIMVDDGAEVTDKIYKRVDHIVVSPRDYGNFTTPAVDKPILLYLPVTLRGDDEEIFRRAIDKKEIVGVVSNNLYTLKFTDKPVLLGTGHNIIGEFDLPHIKSFEADSTGDDMTYVYGRAPVMTLCHCPYNSCKNCSGNDVITDEQGRKFILRRYKAAHCYWELLNCVPHDIMRGGKYEIENKFYDCRGLDEDAIIRVLDGKSTGAYTRGNLNKGLK